MTFRIGLLTLAFSALAACGGGSDRSSTPPAPQADTPPSVPAGPNFAPVAVNDFASVNADSDSVTVSVLSNDSDRDGDSLSILFTGRPSHGVVVIDNNATPSFTSDDRLIYTASAGYVGTDVFSYTITDGRAGRANGYVTLTVGAGGSVTVAANQKPVANSDSAATQAPDAVVIDVLANDTDGDAQELSLFSFSAAANGTVKLDDNGTPDLKNDDRLVYVPNSGFIGGDVVTYSVTDGLDVSNGSVTVQVTAPNQPAIVAGQVCGIVTLGPVNGAAISLYAINAVGQPQGNALAQTQTDPNGRWCVVLPENRSDLLVESRGGVFPDPSDSRYEQGAARLITIASQLALQTLLPREARFAALTVFSNAVLRKSRAEVTGDNFLDVFEGNRAQARASFGLDVFTADVADPVIAAFDASIESKRYAMAVGAAATSLNQIAVDLGVAAPNYVLIDALIRDLSECRLDGRDRNGSVTVLVSGQTRAISNNININLHILRFRNNLPQAYTGIPLLQIDEPACEQVVIRPDTSAPVFTSLPNNLRVVAPIGNSVSASSDFVQRFLSAASAHDARDGSVAVVAGLSDGSALPASFGLGSTAIRFIAVDSAGNATEPVIRFIAVVQVGPPQSYPDRVTTTEDTTITIDVLANDLAQDYPLDTASVQIAVAPEFGAASVGPGSGLIRYVPQANRSGTDQFSYTVADTGGNRSEAVSVLVEVTAQNDAPIAVADVVSTLGSSSRVINVLANDSDVEGGLDYGSLQIITVPVNGLAVVDFVSGSIVYSPTPGFIGTDFFSYRVADSDGVFSEDTSVSISVLDPNAVPNAPPVALNDLVNILEDTVLSIAVLDNDTDIEGELDPDSVFVLQQPLHGFVGASAAAGELEYTPATNYFGTDFFTYQVADSQGQISAPGTVFINVVPQNDRPVAQNDISQGTEGSVVRISLLSNDTDVEGLAGATVILIGQPQSGTAAWDAATAQLVYTPNNGFNGSDTFSYQVEDADGLVSLPASVTINLTGLNDAPVAIDDSFTVQNSTSAELDVLNNDSDVDSPLVYAAISIQAPPANGTVVYDAASDRLIYTSNAAFSGNDSFSYFVSDPDGALSNTVVVTINVEQSRFDPVAVNDTAIALEQTALTISVLNNDIDDDSDIDSSTVVITAQPLFGAATVDVDGQIIYTSADEFSGVDTLTYSVADSFGSRSNTALVTITVSAVNEPPVATDDAAATDEDSFVTINVVANDTDPEFDIDPSTVAITTAAQNGATAVNTLNGSITYTPNADYSGSDSFQYSVADSSGLVSNVATVSVTVASVNDAPVATNDTVSTNEDTAVTVVLLSNDTDVDGTLDTASVVLESLPSQGVATLDTANGTVLYTPDADFFGQDSFSYRMSDDEGTVSNVAQVSVTVNSINDAPEAEDDSLSTDEDVAVTVMLLTNDSDRDGTLDSGSIALETLPSQGVAVVNTVAGTVLYTPDSDFFGQDSFTYRVSDDQGSASNIALVSIIVNTINDVPVANNDVALTNENVAVTINVVQNDIDADGLADITGVQLVGMPATGSVVQGVSFGELVYTPTENSNGNDQFSYQVQDADGEFSNVATVSITVAPQPSSPVVLDRASSVANSSSVDIRVLLGATDPENDIVESTVLVVSDVAQGSSQILSNGQVRYTPNVGYVGTDQFTFAVQDSTGLTSNVGTVSITVTAPNSGPVATDVNSILVFRGDVPGVDLTGAVTDADGTVDFSTLVVGNESVGSAVVQGATGMVQFSVPDDFVGEASFEYSVMDNDGLVSNTAQVLVIFWPSEDQDLDGVAAELEIKIGTDPNTADSVYVYIDPDTPATIPDGSSWTMAYPDLEAAVNDGKIESVPGNFVYVLMAKNSNVTTQAQEWQLTKRSNCDNMIFVGSLDPFVVAPRKFDGGAPRTKFETVQVGSRPLELANCSNIQFHHIAMFGGSGVARGGGVTIESSSVVLDSVYVRNNSAIEAGGGIYVNDNGGTLSTLTIESSTIRNNKLKPGADSDSNGGGLYIENAGGLTITDSIVRHNTAPKQGSVAASNVTGGGGLFVQNTPLYISNTAFSANRTDQCGGGLHLAGVQSMRVEHSNLSGNEARNFGGGLCLRDSDANFTLHNNLFTSNFADTGGGVYAANADKSRITSNTLVFNLADTRGGGVHLDAGADPVFSYNIAQFNVADGSSEDVSGDGGQLLALDASYNFLSSFFANFVGTGNSSQPIEFDSGYYQQQSSPGVNYGAIDSDDLLFALNLRYTNKSGTTTDLGLLDAGYHYLDAEIGSFNDLHIVIPNGLVDDSTNQRLWIAPLVDGKLLGPGHRLYMQSSRSSVETHLYKFTDDTLDPLATGSSTQLRDLGDGYYEVLLDIPDDVSRFDLNVYINSLTDPSFNIQVRD